MGIDQFEENKEFEAFALGMAHARDKKGDQILTEERILAEQARARAELAESKASAAESKASELTRHIRMLFILTIVALMCIGILATAIPVTIRSIIRDEIRSTPAESVEK